MALGEGMELVSPLEVPQAAFRLETLGSIEAKGPRVRVTHLPSSEATSDMIGETETYTGNDQAVFGRHVAGPYGLSLIHI